MPAILHLPAAPIGRERGNCRVREFGRVLRGPSWRTLNEPHEPLLTIDDDFASPPAVFEPVVACSQRARGQARRRTSTSCGLHENRRDRHFRIYPSNMAMGIRDIEPDFLGRVPPTIRLPPNDIDVGSVARVVDCLVALAAPAHEDRHLTTMELVRSGSPLVGRAMKSNGSWAVVSAIISCRLPRNGWIGLLVAWQRRLFTIYGKMS